LGHALKLLIIGNSGSGKSTLAARFCEQLSAEHLDLDTLAWETDVIPPTRRAMNSSVTGINAFTTRTEHWVVEGCYTDLLELLITEASHLVFLDLPIEACIDNAKQRPWEPHKYSSKSEQNKNLPMLMGWIEQYDERVDTFSYVAHDDFFERFLGVKARVCHNTYELGSIF